MKILRVNSRIKFDEDEPSKVQRQDLSHVANTLNEEVNQGIDESLLEKEQVHTGIHSESKEIPLIDEVRVDSA